MCSSIEKRAEDVAAEEFWADQDAKPFWCVPMGKEGGSSSIFERRCGMLVALARARRLGRRTPLLVDTSEHKVIDTYFTYRHAQFVEAKGLFLRERGGTPHEELMEELRAALVNAMRHGHLLYVRLANSACDFVGRYSDAQSFPLSVFHAPTVAALNDLARDGTDLARSDHAFAAVLRPSDARESYGVFVPKEGFEVVVCTHFAAESFAEFLDGRLPMDSLQPIVPLVRDA